MAWAGLTPVSRGSSRDQPWNDACAHQLLVPYSSNQTAIRLRHNSASASMSTAVWPPIEAAQLVREQAASQARELDWLLVQLRETLQSLKAGLEECAALLAPTENGSTLVLSSVRSESLKGLVTRVGTRIVKGVSPLSQWPAACFFPPELT